MSSKHGIITAPIEFYGRLLSSGPETFCQEMLSISSGAIHPFFRDFHKVSDSVGSYPNGIHSDTYTLNKDFFPASNAPVFAHVDLSINRDNCGLGIGHAKKFVPMAQRNAGESHTQVLMVPFVHLDILANLRPRPEFGEREMNYEAILKLFIDLDIRGFNLKEGLITLDRFQSHWLITALRSEGFCVGMVSVDHTTSKVINDPANPPDYITKVSIPREPAAAMVSLRDAMYQDRLETPVIEDYDSTLNWLQKEALDIEWNEDVQKHKKIEGGSDNLIQAAAGTVFNCMNNTLGDPIEMNKRLGEVDTKDSFYDQFDKNLFITEGQEIDPELGYVPDDGNSPLTSSPF